MSHVLEGREQGLAGEGEFEEVRQLHPTLQNRGITMKWF